ncbi:Chaperone protein HtpG [Clostridium tyrobutyricum]|nr:Chaperone protein HtpG [Clostridium tyrobutyricum]
MAMENQGIEYTLEKHLKYLCEENYQYKELIATWEMDKKVYKDMLQAVAYNFPHYSMHESSHSKSIISNIEMVLGEGRIKLLGPTETWMILESAYLHDFGMILQNEYVEDIWKSNLFQEFLKESCKFADKDLQEAAYYILNLKESISKDKSNKDWPVKVRRYVVEIIAAYFRADHPKRSMDYINAFDKNLKFDLTHGNLIKARLIKLIGKVAFLHGQSFEEVKELKYKSVGLKSDYIHPRFIAEMIRLGDVLDIDNGRFNEILIRVFGKLPEMSKIHFKKHGDITHILISPTAIEVTADCSDDDEIRETRKWFDWIKDEIRNITVDWMDIVPENFEGYPPKIRSLKIFKNGKADEGISDLKLEIPRQRMFEILEGSGIYKNKIDFLRELIQNALDASKIQLWRDLKSGMYDPWIKNDVELKDLTPFDIDKAVYESYKVIIKIESIKDNNEKIRIKVIDRGIGISKDNLKNMSCVGKSWDKRDKFKDELKDMPLWLKPTGGFGIGIQSCFMVSDEIYIKTKTDEDRINVREIKIESGKENGYITSEIYENENFKRGSEVIVNVPKDLNKSYTLGGYTHSRLKDYDSFSSPAEDKFYLWTIVEYIGRQFNSQLFKLELFYDNRHEESYNSFIESYKQYSNEDGEDKFKSTIRYLFKIDKENLNEMYLWDRKYNLFIKITLIPVKIYGNNSSVFYFKGVNIKDTFGFHTSVFSIFCDIYGMDVNETLTLNRQEIRNESQSFIYEILYEAIKFTTEKYKEKIKKDKEFISKINSLSLKILFDKYNINDETINNKLIENCNDTIYVLRKRNNKLEDIPIDIKTILKESKINFIHIENFTHKNEILSYLKSEFNSEKLNCQYIINNQELENVIKSNYNLKGVNKVDIDMNNFKNKNVYIYTYELLKKRSPSIIQMDNNAKRDFLKKLYSGFSKRKAIIAIKEYENLSVSQLPKEYSSFRYNGIGNSYAIISPIIKEDGERIKDNGTSIKTIKEEIKNRADFKNLVNYVYENRINKETTKEDIVKDYMKLIDEYCDIVRNK